MRDTIYRGKRVDNGQWVEGSLVTWTDGVFIAPINTCLNIPEKYSNYGELVAEIMDHFIRVLPSTIGQYSGVNDRKENKIFEGDCLAVGEIQMVVEFIRGCFYTPRNGSNYRLGGWEQNKIEILGNIHDSPYLIQQ